MKILHFSIMIGCIIAVVTVSTLIYFGGLYLLQSENFRIVKIEKLSGYDRIWQDISREAGDSLDYIVTGDFDWSHKGNFVAFNMGAGAPISYLYTMDANGSEITPATIPIVFNSVSYIHVSPDDNSIYFVGQYNVKNETFQDIFRYYLNNKTYSLITKDSHVYSFDFMPNGDIIYLDTHSNSTRLEIYNPMFLIRHYDVLWLATPDGHKIKPIYNGTQQFDGMVVNPDGNKIAFVSRDDPLHPSSNGTDVVNLGSLPPFTVNPSYFTIFDMNTDEFTILAQSNDDEFWNLKWTSSDHILYETYTHHCVQDIILGVRSCPAGLLNMMTVPSQSSQVLYGNQSEPYTAPLVGASISPDGRSLIFGINYDYSNGDIDGKGIYLMEFEKSLVSVRN